ncbi:MAG: hypothetical protein MN733_31435, partial [Nitrososphaera sp.]|nr:hypothetical protein [Nitrososphaera sp.]
SQNPQPQLDELHRQVEVLVSSLDTLLSPWKIEGIDSDIRALLLDGKIAPARGLLSERLQQVTAKKGLYFSTLASIALREFDIDNYLEHARAASHEQPENFDYLGAYVDALFRSGQIEQAYSTARQALESGKISPGLGHAQLQWFLATKDCGGWQTVDWAREYESCHNIEPRPNVPCPEAKVREDSEKCVSRIQKIEQELLSSQSQDQSALIPLYSLSRQLMALHNIRGEAERSLRYKEKSEKVLLIIEEHSSWAATSLEASLFFLDILGSFSLREARARLSHLLRLVDGLPEGQLANQYIPPYIIPELRASLKALVYLDFSLLYSLAQDLHKSRRALELAVGTLESARPITGERQFLHARLMF